MTNSHATKILQYIPEKIEKQNLSAFKQNGSLFTDDQFANVTRDLTNKTIGRYPKSGFAKYGITFGVYKSHDDIYAIYNHAGTQYEIGRGGSGAVKVLFGHKTGKLKALKTQKIGPVSHKDLENEHAILEKLGMTTEPYTERWSEKAKLNKAEILMEYIPGRNLESLQHLRNKQNTPESKWTDLVWLDIALKILHALHEIHLKGILHRDIKASNLIFDIVHNKLSVTDFGRAVFCKGADEKSIGYALGESEGSVGYQAPEIKGYGFSLKYHEKTEIYAAGVLLQEILFNQKIVSNDYDSWQYQPSYTTFFESRKNGATGFSQEKLIHELLKNMQAEISEQRPTFATAINILTQYRKEFIAAHPQQYQRTQRLYQIAAFKEQYRLEQVSRVISEQSLFGFSRKKEFKKFNKKLKRQGLFGKSGLENEEKLMNMPSTLQNVKFNK